MTPRPRIRLWPAWAILFLALGALVWVWSGNSPQRQTNYLRTGGVGLITLVLLLIWLMAFSRLRWQIRLISLAAMAGLVLLIMSCFKIHGVTGDLLPILEWRWAAAPKSPLPAEPSASVAQLTTNLAGASLAVANDYPQFLGPHRNATVSGPRLARDWQREPPVLLWRQAVGAAWSGFAITGNYAVTQEQWGEKEMVVAYELRSGKRWWSHADEAHYQNVLAGEGPRATPTIAGQFVFVLGATGILNCLELATGKMVWSRNLIQEHQTRLNEWGMSGSPLVVDDFVVVAPGGGVMGRSLVAYGIRTGELAWSGGDDAGGYSSPYLVTLWASRQVLFFSQHGLASHDPASGLVWWKYPWPGGHPHVAMPVVLPNDRVLVSSGYGTGSELLQVKKDPSGAWSASRLWKSRALKAKFTNVVHREGYIYGLDDGILVCVDAATGERKWKGERYGHGQVILVNDLLLILAETGVVVLFEPMPQEPRELARLAVFADKTWNPPALAGQLLLVRNDKEAACFRLPLVSQGRNSE